MTSKSMQRAAWCAGVIVTAGLAALASAAVVEQDIGIGGDVTMPLYGGTGDDTGARILNSSSATIHARVEDVVTVLPRAGETVHNSFILLDNTLKVTVTPTSDGRMRQRARMEYTDRALRQKGVRERSLRLLRLDRTRNKWRPCWVAIERPERARVARQRNRPRDFILGHYGYDMTDNYVWAVIDVDGEYAIGGVPEPATLAILGAGLGLLICRRKRQH